MTHSTLPIPFPPSTSSGVPAAPFPTPLPRPPRIRIKLEVLKEQEDYIIRDFAETLRIPDADTLPIHILLQHLASTASTYGLPSHLRLVGDVIVRASELEENAAGPVLAQVEVPQEEEQEEQNEEREGEGEGGLTAEEIYPFARFPTPEDEFSTPPSPRTPSARSPSPPPITYPPRPTSPSSNDISPYWLHNMADAVAASRAALLRKYADLKDEVKDLLFEVTELQMELGKEDAAMSETIKVLQKYIDPELIQRVLKDGMEAVEKGFLKQYDSDLDGEDSDDDSEDGDEDGDDRDGGDKGNVAPKTSGPIGSKRTLEEDVFGRGGGLDSSDEEEGGPAHPVPKTPTKKRAREDEADDADDNDDGEDGDSEMEVERSVEITGSPTRSSGGYKKRKLMGEGSFFGSSSDGSDASEKSVHLDFDWMGKWDDDDDSQDGGYSPEEGSDGGSSSGSDSECSEDSAASDFIPVYHLDSDESDDEDPTHLPTVPIHTIVYTHMPDGRGFWSVVQNTESARQEEEDEDILEGVEDETDVTAPPLQPGQPMGPPVPPVGWPPVPLPPHPFGPPPVWPTGPHPPFGAPPPPAPRQLRRDYMRVRASWTGEPELFDPRN